MGCFALGTCQEAAACWPLLVAVPCMALVVSGVLQVALCQQSKWHIYPRVGPDSESVVGAAICGRSIYGSSCYTEHNQPCIHERLLKHVIGL